MPTEWNKIALLKDTCYQESNSWPYMDFQSFETYLEIRC